jgi:hypothetical protein
MDVQDTFFLFIKWKHDRNDPDFPTPDKIICATDTIVSGDETIAFANKTNLSMPETMRFVI